MRTAVWYASKKRWDSKTKFVVFDDRGPLECGHGRFVFHGHKQQIIAERITDVRLDRPVFPLLAWTVTIIGTFLFLALYMSLVLSSLGSTAQIIGGVVLLAGSALALWVNRRQQWVVVEGEDADGDPVVGRFHDASNFGWNGILTGNRHLADALSSERTATPSEE